tara:strand:+ start:323 stop:517 length:195 start_codon:yes stop_codon:yes gene_type:complete
MIKIINFTNKIMKDILKTRVAFYVGFGVMYTILSEIVGFEYTVLWCLGTIIGEQGFLAIDRNTL